MIWSSRVTVYEFIVEDMLMSNEPAEFDAYDNDLPGRREPVLGNDSNEEELYEEEEEDIVDEEQEEPHPIVVKPRSKVPFKPGQQLRVCCEEP